MDRSEKIRQKMLRSPNSITIQEVIIFMVYNGLSLNNIRGSHFIFKNPATGEKITIPSHNKKVKKAYVKQILKLIRNNNEKI